MSSRKWIAALLGLGVGGYVIYQLLKPKPIEERKDERTPEELRRECKARVSIICSQAGGALRDKCLDNEISIASYECLDIIHQCCISVTTQRDEVVEAPQPNEGRKGRIGITGGATTTTTTGGAVVTPTPTPTPTPPPYQPPPEIPIEVLQPGCPASLPMGPYDSPLPETVTETIKTINPFGRKITATIIKKCYCVALGPADKPYYCCACPQILCPPGYYPSDVSDGREESFFVYPGLWCNKT
jgi:hypothetical protein